MQNQYISISFGILLVTVTVIICAFLVLVAAVIIVRTIQNEKDRRASVNLANLREELRKDRLARDAHEDDLK